MTNGYSIHATIFTARVHRLQIFVSILNTRLIRCRPGHSLLLTNVSLVFFLLFEFKLIAKLATFSWRQAVLEGIEFLAFYSIFNIARKEA